MLVVVRGCYRVDAEDVHALVRLIQLGRPSSPVPPERGPDAEGLVLSMLSIDSKVRNTQ